MKKLDYGLLLSVVTAGILAVSAWAVARAQAAEVPELRERVHSVQMDQAINVEQHRQMMEALRRLEQRLGTLPAPAER